jgi:hypothetical protein
MDQGTQPHPCCVCHFWEQSAQAVTSSEQLDDIRLSLNELPLVIRKWLLGDRTSSLCDLQPIVLEASVFSFVRWE